MEYCPGNQKNQKRKGEILGPPGRSFQEVSGELVLSDFDQSNLRRGYDGKC